MPLLVEAMAPLLAFQHIVALHCTAQALRTSSAHSPWPTATESVCPARTGVRILGAIPSIRRRRSPAHPVPSLPAPLLPGPCIMCVGASSSGSNALLAFHYKRAALVEYRDVMWILYRPLVQEQERTCCISHNVYLFLIDFWSTFISPSLVTIAPFLCPLSGLGYHFSQSIHLKKAVWHR